MPLHGKIVVIKRNGGDGTEFPLTASCLFGRMPDCDIRIQLPQVSKEHCRIDLNENKEVILTNLSSVNPTRVNGEVLQQSERLKHGDVITVIDRSFRFEYPPAPTPKKRSSVGSKAETLKVRQDQQVDGTVEAGEKRASEVSTDPHLKDGANHDNIQRSVENAMDLESKEDSCMLENKTTSPFSDLYQMIKKSLDVKTPWKSSASQPQTPSSKLCTPRPGSVRKNVGKPNPAEVKSTPKKNEDTDCSGAETPQSVKKQSKSFQGPSAVMAETENSTKLETTSSQKKQSTLQKFTVHEVIEQISDQTPKSPMRRRSKEGTPAKAALTGEQQAAHLEKASPSNSGKAEKVSRKRKSGELGADLPASLLKRKRVSFGGYLSPELFDKRMPPDSPLRKGATPRRSLSLLKPKESLLRRASVIGLLKHEQKSQTLKSRVKKGTPSPKKSSSTSASPKTPKSRSSSPKAAKKSPQNKSPSPAKKTPRSKSPSPAGKTPKSKSSPKAASSAKKTPRSKSPSPAGKTPKSKSSPKAASSAKKSPQNKSPSPAKKTPRSKSPSPAGKTPKSKSSPKAATPAKETPRSRSSSPKAASPTGKSPKSKTPSPARGRSPAKKVQTPKASEQPKTPDQVAHKETPASKRRSFASGNNASIAATPAKTPSGSALQTPTVQGRFSVSRISTPSPTAEVDAVIDQVPVVMVTPKIPLKRKSMKSTSRKTPGAAKSAVKVMHRRSCISRASMKVLNSWADIVKFGKTKAQVVPVKKVVAKKTTKKAVSKPQTPARKHKGHMSTGHADSPATIVVGRAHKQMAAQPTGAVPRMVTNTALFKKNMKMDEDLTGVSEMFKTPVNERKRRSTKSAGCLNTSVIEPSVLSTPEETGEMMVSPLSVASALKGRTYGSEAVQRLLDADQECSFICDSDIPSESSYQHDTDVKATTVTTPKQKPQLPECPTGVKRIMKTPRQTVEPVEDLRGKILKTPKQKPKQQECLTGVKRIMKTPRQKAEPVEDLRGRILKTPKQKTEHKECLTGVKRIMKTPRGKAEPLEDIRGKLLVTPKQKPEHQECLTGMKRIFETPKQAEPIEDLEDKHLKTPKAPEAGDMSFGVVKELLVTPAHMQGSEMTEKSFPTPCHLGIKRKMKTPKEKSAPVEDMVGVKRLMRTPKQKGEPVEENFGIKRLMKSPRLRGNAPVEDFEGLQELMEEPVADSTEYQEMKDEIQMSVESDDVLLQKSKDDEVHEKANEKIAETNMPSTDPGQEKKPVRGSKAKTVQAKTAQDKEEAPQLSEEPVTPAPTRGRRGKKAEAAAPPAVRHTTRGRTAKNTESKDVELLKEEGTLQPSKVALKPRRGRNAKKASDLEVEMPQEVLPEPESEIVSQLAQGGRDEEEQVWSGKQKMYTQADMSKGVKEIPDQLEELPGGRGENKPLDAMETVPEAPEIESTLNVEVTEVRPAVVQKTARGRKGKAASKEVEDKSKAAEASEEPVAPAAVRGRRGKKTEGTVAPAARQMTRMRNTKESSKQPIAETQLETEISTETMSEQTSDSKPSTEEAVVKPVRGRKTKQTTPADQAQTEVEKDKAMNEPLKANAQPQQPIVANPRRGTKAKANVIEQDDVAAAVPVESSEQRQPPARAKRGRSAKMDDGETVQSQEPVKKGRRTRKAEQKQVEPAEEVKPIQMAVPEEAEVPLIEPVTVSEQDAVAAKPRRGGRKIKQDTESASTEVPANGVADKPRRGRKAKVTEEVTAENPEHELEAEKVKTAEPVPVKPSKRRGVKTATSEVPQAVPAKRTHRGTAVPLEDTNAESTVQVSESEPVKPAKRGRRAAAAKPTEEKASEQDVPSNTNASQKSVQWNMDVEVFDVSKETPVKAVRGRRKTKRDTESKDVSSDSNKTEEEDLSGKAVEAQPVKRVRRGAAADKAESTSRAEDNATEPQPRTRRGRLSKK